MGVTLACIDCVDLGRALAAVNFSMRGLSFEQVFVLTSLDFSGFEKESVETKFVKIRHLGSTPEYSEFVLKELYTYIATPLCLIIQYDGFILNPEAWSDDFWDYDYIGAPWMLFDERDPLYGIVGNGGFCLRSKRFMELVAHDDAIQNIDYEDRTVCYHHKHYIEAKGLKFCPLETARNFSIEGGTWNGQLGFHSFLLTVIPDYALVDYSYADESKKWIIDYHQKMPEGQSNGQLNYLSKLMSLSVGTQNATTLLLTSFVKARNILLNLAPGFVKCFMSIHNHFFYWYLKSLAKARGIELDLHFLKDTGEQLDGDYALIFADADIDRKKISTLITPNPGWNLLLQGPIPPGVIDYSLSQITYIADDLTVISSSQR